MPSEACANSAASCKTTRPIYVRNPARLAGELLAQRIPLGQRGDYKPMIARCPDGQMLLCAFRGYDLPDQSSPDGRRMRHEDIILSRSSDDGHTWTPFSVVPGRLGREPYLSLLSDGTLWMTAHLIHREHRNIYGHHVQSYLYRSTDAGHTWQPRQIIPDEYPSPAWVHTSRNVHELPNGSIIVLVSGGFAGAADLIYRSTDGGQTWSHRSTLVRGKPHDCDVPYWAEAYLWQARSGRLLAIARVSRRTWPDGWPANAIAHSDRFERMIVLASADQGATWDFVQDLGGVGMMYPSVLRLKDGRLLLTYTSRAADVPLGVRAVVGAETHEGFDFRFDRDVVLIDDQTPAGLTSGGGFGNTIQLENGELLTPYSYRASASLTRQGEGDLTIELCRWRLP